MEDQCCTSCEHISNTSETSYIYLWNISLRLARTSSIIIDINHNRLHPMRNNKTIRKYSPGSCRLCYLDTCKSKWSIIYTWRNWNHQKASEETNYWNQNTWQHTFFLCSTPTLPPKSASKIMSSSPKPPSHVLSMTSHHLFCTKMHLEIIQLDLQQKLFGFSNP